MSTALTTVEQHPAPVVAGAYERMEGMEGFDDKPLKPSEYELVQFTSQNQVATPGNLRNRTTGEEFKDIRVIPLKYWSGRVLFPPGSDLTAKPLCKSVDGVKPANFQGLVPQSPYCDTCDFGKKSWSVGVPPKCKEVVRWLFINADTGIPFYLTAKGTGVKPSKNIIAALREYATVSKHKGEPRSLFDYTFTIKPQFESSQKGKWYSLQFTDIAKVAEVGKYAALYRAITSRPATVEQVDGDVEQLVEETIEA